MRRYKTYKDFLPRHLRPAVPPQAKLRTTKRPGDKELLPNGQWYTH